MFKGRFLLPVLMMMVLIAPQAQAENTLTLDKAYALVLGQNPQVQSYRARIMAAEGNRLQESLMPNPQAVFEAENFGGDDPRSGFDATEYTLGIEQQLEIAGKRSKREQVADIEKQHVSQEALAGIQATLAQTKAAYMRMAIARERLSLAGKRVTLADKTHTTVKTRINAAKSADIQHTKADIEVSAAKVEQRKAEKELSVSKIALANLMGLAAFEQDIAADLTVLSDVPEREAIMQAIEQTPMSVMSKLSVMREDAALSLARANGVADPTFGFGLRRFAEDDGTAFLASISIPITVFDRNQGRVAEAKANLLAAQSDQTARRLNLEKQVMNMWQNLVSARAEVLAYQDGLLPSATKAYAQAEEGFNRGAFSFLDLLDAQRTLFDMQENHLEALASFHETKAQIDMLSGVYAQVAASTLEQNITEKE
jgi:cobalt-zinc-cadmium efflux system outer membrane protein